MASTLPELGRLAAGGLHGLLLGGQQDRDAGSLFLRTDNTPGQCGVHRERRLPPIGWREASNSFTSARVLLSYTRTRIYGIAMLLSYTRVLLSYTRTQVLVQHRVCSRAAP